jgi:single-strand DNA-binding protein
MLLYILSGFYIIYVLQFKLHYYQENFMAKSINHVQLLGFCGKDPEMRYQANGDAIANFSLATSKHWKDKEGNKKESTEWHRCVAFNKLAEIIGEYARKGTQLIVDGELRTRKWENKEGIAQYTTEIVLSSVNLLSKKDDNGGQGSDEGNRGSSSASRTGDKNSASRTPPPPEDFDDDIPF